MGGGGHNIIAAGRYLQKFMTHPSPKENDNPRLTKVGLLQPPLRFSPVALKKDTKGI